MLSDGLGTQADKRTYEVTNLGEINEFWKDARRPEVTPRCQRRSRMKGLVRICPVMQLPMSWALSFARYCVYRLISGLVASGRHVRQRNFC